MADLYMLEGSSQEEENIKSYVANNGETPWAFKEREKNTGANWKTEKPVSYQKLSTEEYLKKGSEGLDAFQQSYISQDQMYNRGFSLAHGINLNSNLYSVDDEQLKAVHKEALQDYAKFSRYQSMSANEIRREEGLLNREKNVQDVMDMMKGNEDNGFSNRTIAEGMIDLMPGMVNSILNNSKDGEFSSWDAAKAGVAGFGDLFFTTPTRALIGGVSELTGGPGWAVRANQTELKDEGWGGDDSKTIMENMKETYNAFKDDTWTTIKEVGIGMITDGYSNAMMMASGGMTSGAAVTKHALRAKKYAQIMNTVKNSKQAKVALDAATKLSRLGKFKEAGALLKKSDLAAHSDDVLDVLNKMNNGFVAKMSRGAMGMVNKTKAGKVVTAYREFGEGTGVLNAAKRYVKDIPIEFNKSGVEGIAQNYIYGLDKDLATTYAVEGFEEAAMAPVMKMAMSSFGYGIEGFRRFTSNADDVQMDMAKKTLNMIQDNPDIVNVEEQMRMDNVNPTPEEVDAMNSGDPVRENVAKQAIAERVRSNRLFTEEADLSRKIRDFRYANQFVGNNIGFEAINFRDVSDASKLMNERRARAKELSSIIEEHKQGGKKDVEVAKIYGKYTLLEKAKPNEDGYYNFNGKPIESRTEYESKVTAARDAELDAYFEKVGVTDPKIKEVRQEYAKIKKELILLESAALDMTNQVMYRNQFNQEIAAARLGDFSNSSFFANLSGQDIDKINADHSMLEASTSYNRVHEFLSGYLQDPTYVEKKLSDIMLLETSANINYDNHFGNKNNSVRNPINSVDNVVIANSPYSKGTVGTNIVIAQKAVHEGFYKALTKSTGETAIPAAEVKKLMLEFGHKSYISPFASLADMEIDIDGLYRFRNSLVSNARKQNQFKYDYVITHVTKIHDEIASRLDSLELELFKPNLDEVTRDGIYRDWRELMALKYSTMLEASNVLGKDGSVYAKGLDDFGFDDATLNRIKEKSKIVFDEDTQNKLKEEMLKEQEAYEAELNEEGHFDRPGQHADLQKSIANAIRNTMNPEANSEIVLESNGDGTTSFLIEINGQVVEGLVKEDGTVVTPGILRIQEAIDSGVPEQDLAPIVEQAKVTDEAVLKTINPKLYKDFDSFIDTFSSFLGENINPNYLDELKILYNKTVSTGASFDIDQFISDLNYIISSNTDSSISSILASEQERVNAIKVQAARIEAALDSNDMETVQSSINNLKEMDFVFDEDASPREIATKAQSMKGPEAGQGIASADGKQKTNRSYVNHIVKAYQNKKVSYVGILKDLSSSTVRRALFLTEIGKQNFDHNKSMQMFYKMAEEQAVFRMPGFNGLLSVDKVDDQWVNIFAYGKEFGDAGVKFDIRTSDALQFFMDPNFNLKNVDFRIDTKFKRMAHSVDQKSSFDVSWSYIKTGYDLGNTDLDKLDFAAKNFHSNRDSHWETTDKGYLPIDSKVNVPFTASPANIAGRSFTLLSTEYKGHPVKFYVPFVEATVKTDPNLNLSNLVGATQSLETNAPDVDAGKTREQDIKEKQKDPTLVGTDDGTLKKGAGLKSVKTVAKGAALVGAGLAGYGMSGEEDESGKLSDAAQSAMMFASLPLASRAHRFISDIQAENTTGGLPKPEYLKPVTDSMLLTKSSLRDYQVMNRTAMSLPDYKLNFSSAFRLGTKPLVGSEVGNTIYVDKLSSNDNGLVRRMMSQPTGAISYIVADNPSDPNNLFGSKYFHTNFKTLGYFHNGSDFIVIAQKAGGPRSHIEYQTSIDHFNGETEPLDLLNISAGQISQFISNYRMLSGQLRPDEFDVMKAKQDRNPYGLTETDLSDMTKSNKAERGKSIYNIKLDKATGFLKHLIGPDFDLDMFEQTIKSGYNLNLVNESIGKLNRMIDKEIRSKSTNSARMGKSGSTVKTAVYKVEFEDSNPISIPRRYLSKGGSSKSLTIYDNFKNSVKTLVEKAAGNYEVTKPSFVKADDGSNLNAGPIYAVVSKMPTLDKRLQPHYAEARAKLEAVAGTMTDYQFRLIMMRGHEKGSGVMKFSLGTKEANLNAYFNRYSAEQIVNNALNDALGYIKTKAKQGVEAKAAIDRYHHAAELQFRGRIDQATVFENSSQPELLEIDRNSPQFKAISEQMFQKVEASSIYSEARGVKNSKPQTIIKKYMDYGGGIVKEMKSYFEDGNDNITTTKEDLFIDKAQRTLKQSRVVDFRNMSPEDAEMLMNDLTSTSVTPIVAIGYPKDIDNYGGGTKFRIATRALEDYNGSQVIGSVDVDSFVSSYGKEVIPKLQFLKGEKTISELKQMDLSSDFSSFLDDQIKEKLANMFPEHYAKAEEKFNNFAEKYPSEKMESYLDEVYKLSLVAKEIAGDELKDNRLKGSVDRAVKLVTTIADMMNDNRMFENNFSLFASKVYGISKPDGFMVTDIVESDFDKDFEVEIKPNKLDKDSKYIVHVSNKLNDIASELESDLVAIARQSGSNLKEIMSNPNSLNIKDIKRIQVIKQMSSRLLDFSNFIDDCSSTFEAITNMYNDIKDSFDINTKYSQGQISSFNNTVDRMASEVSILKGLGDDGKVITERFYDELSQNLGDELTADILSEFNDADLNLALIGMQDGNPANISIGKMFKGVPHGRAGKALMTVFVNEGKRIAENMDNIKAYYASNNLGHLYRGTEERMDDSHDIKEESIYDGGDADFSAYREDSVTKKSIEKFKASEKFIKSIGLTREDVVNVINETEASPSEKLTSVSKAIYEMADEGADIDAITDYVASVMDNMGQAPMYLNDNGVKVFDPRSKIADLDLSKTYEGVDPLDAYKKFTEDPDALNALERYFGIESSPVDISNADYVGTYFLIKEVSANSSALDLATGLKLIDPNSKDYADLEPESLNEVAANLLVRHSKGGNLIKLVGNKQLDELAKFLNNNAHPDEHGNIVARRQMVKTLWSAHKVAAEFPGMLLNLLGQEGASGFEQLNPYNFQRAIKAYQKLVFQKDFRYLSNDVIKRIQSVTDIGKLASWMNTYAERLGNPSLKGNERTEITLGLGKIFEHYTNVIIGESIALSSKKSLLHTTDKKAIRQNTIKFVKEQLESITPNKLIMLANEIELYADYKTKNDVRELILEKAEDLGMDIDELHLKTKESHRRSIQANIASLEMINAATTVVAHGLNDGSTDGIGVHSEFKPKEQSLNEKAAAMDYSMRDYLKKSKEKYKFIGNEPIEPKKDYRNLEGIGPSPKSSPWVVVLDSKGNPVKDESGEYVIEPSPKSYNIHRPSSLSKLNPIILGVLLGGTAMGIQSLAGETEEDDKPIYGAGVFGSLFSLLGLSRRAGRVPRADRGVVGIHRKADVFSGVSTLENLYANSVLDKLSNSSPEAIVKPSEFLAAKNSGNDIDIVGSINKAEVKSAVRAAKTISQVDEIVKHYASMGFKASHLGDPLNVIMRTVNSTVNAGGDLKAVIESVQEINPSRFEGMHPEAVKFARKISEIIIPLRVEADLKGLTDAQFDPSFSTSKVNDKELYKQFGNVESSKAFIKELMKINELPNDKLDVVGSLNTVLSRISRRQPLNKGQFNNIVRAVTELFDGVSVDSPSFREVNSLTESMIKQYKPTGLGGGQYIGWLPNIVKLPAKYEVQSFDAINGKIHRLIKGLSASEEFGHGFYRLRSYLGSFYQDPKLAPVAKELAAKLENEYSVSLNDDDVYNGIDLKEWYDQVADGLNGAASAALVTTNLRSAANNMAGLTSIIGLYGAKGYKEFTSGMKKLAFDNMSKEEMAIFMELNGSASRDNSVEVNNFRNNAFVDWMSETLSIHTEKMDGHQSLEAAMKSMRIGLSAGEKISMKKSIPGLVATIGAPAAHQFYTAVNAYMMMGSYQLGSGYAFDYSLKKLRQAQNKGKVAFRREIADLENFLSESEIQSLLAGAEPTTEQRQSAGFYFAKKFNGLSISKSMDIENGSSLRKMFLKFMGVRSRIAKFVLYDNVISPAYEAIKRGDISKATAMKIVSKPAVVLTMSGVGASIALGIVQSMFNLNDYQESELEKAVHRGPYKATDWDKTKVIANRAFAAMSSQAFAPIDVFDFATSFTEGKLAPPVVGFLGGTVKSVDEMIKGDAVSSAQKFLPHVRNVMKMSLGTESDQELYMYSKLVGSERIEEAINDNRETLEGAGYKQFITKLLAPIEQGPNMGYGRVSPDKSVKPEYRGQKYRVDQAANILQRGMYDQARQEQ